MSIIPQGSNVLVTGANGFLASHVVDQFLSAGYKVRGAVRSEAKGQWLVDHFTKAYGPGCFELAIVSDMSITGAFDEALTGISGIAHVASDVTFSSNVGEVMSTVEGAIKSILESAMKMPVEGLDGIHGIYPHSNSIWNTPHSNSNYPWSFHG
jgi:nucleoside-diphosphate-sugar epimerase